MTKKLFSFALLMVSALTAMAQAVSVSSPNGKLKVDITCQNGQAAYTVSYDGKTMMTPSALGLKTDIGDYTKGLKLTDSQQSSVDKTYTMTRTKTASSHFVANQLDVTLTNADDMPMVVTFLVSDNDIAFRYTLQKGKLKDINSVVIQSEATGFNFPDQATSFICPQSKPMVGFAQTKPSYEEEYTADAAINTPSAFGEGYTFPCLFRIGEDGWVLVSETGVGSNYVGTHLSDFEQGKGYTIAFPNPGEMKGMGSNYAGINLPGSTPWRTITVGATLKPIVETTIPYDVVEPLYEAKQEYCPGRYTWGWLIWQDNSTIYEDQVKMIDLASEMGYEYTLVDALWDTQIGRDRIEELSKYAQSKGVRLLLWYNSNGTWNDAPQGPHNGMSTAIAREREMAWMEKIGVAGIKVDFFGSDKQEMMKLYEDILTDGNRHGLQVIFHGCTLPRGWERMYPNYVASEAFLASENVFFTEHHAKQEGFELTMHPYCRNAVAAMDWGGVIMNKFLSKDNRSRHRRYTTDVFEMATGITNQSAVNCVAMQPNNLEELPQWELEWLRRLPTTWDETRFIDGYPGRYVVLARRHGTDWYVAGLNALQEPLRLMLDLPMLAGETVRLLTDNKKGLSLPATLKVDKKGKAKVELQPAGGLIIQR
jgi:hypothetical protein